MMRLLVGVVLMLTAMTAGAQSPAEKPPDDFHVAEKHFHAGRLFQAAELFEKLSRDEKSRDRDRGFDRLITIYLRLGRSDQAIQTGERYLAWLKQTGDGKVARLVEVQMAACWWSLGHHVTAEQLLTRAMDVSVEDFPLSSQVMALEMLARCRAKGGDKVAARKSWARIESMLVDRLNHPEGRLEEKERIPLTRKWGESLRGQERYAQAEEVFKSLLAIHDRNKNAAGESDTWRELAALYRERNDLALAESALDKAMKFQEKVSDSSPATLGDLSAERSEILQLQKKTKESKTWRDKAIGHYQKALEKPGEAVAEGTSSVLLFWKLQNLVQTSQQFRKALELTQTQAEQWAGGGLISSKLAIEQGSLHLMLGSSVEGRRQLRDAVEALERQSPWNLIELPRAYINLAAIESTSDDLDRAEQLVNKTLSLYRTYQLGDDAVTIEACNLRGSLAAQKGDYAKAIQYFREGLERCRDNTLEAPVQRSNLLLNIALLHKSQGELPEAIAMCSRALAEFEKIAEPDALGFAAFDAGLANMYLAQNQLTKAFEKTERIMRLCQKHGVDRGPLVVTAKHIRGVHFLRNRDVVQAEKEWHDVMALQKLENQTLLLPRTLNYLALAAEWKNDRTAAEDYYRQALKLQANNQRSYPATHFITLWRLANVVKDDRRSHAQEYIDQSIRLVESARLRMFGDAQQRATFFAQFGPAFEQSIEWHLQNKDVEAAFQVLTRGRSRTLMDQLQMANLDPLATLTGPDAARLKRREGELRSILAALRAKAGLIGIDDLSPEQTKKLLAEFDQAQNEYSEVWREIWNASPEYHSLADPTLPEQILPKLRRKILGPKTVLLAYHLGRTSSQVLLLGDSSVASVSYPLDIPENLAANIAPREPTEPDRALAELRGVAIVPKAGGKTTAPAPPPPLPEKVEAQKRVSLTQDVARALIDRYRQEILDRDYEATRGFVIRARDPKQPIPTQRPEVVGDVFLPRALRDRLRELNPETVIVIPDGPLHTLPLESLILEAGAKPRFVLDELPPIVYAPSAAILAMLSDRPPAAGRAEPTLLTVCNPSYPLGKAGEIVADVRGSEGFVGFAGQLPRLPFTDQESKQVRQHFAKDRVTVISESSATERRVAESIAGKTIVHIAAHGFADSRFGNLFGALALAPSSALGTPASDDDGFLSLHEIYRLPLQECDVAVLSACLTHVGPQQPMEAGVTLANGFLSAGARRVVASHWSVSDRSTSQLMSYFFEAMNRDDNGQRMSAPRAMQEARRRLRDSSERNWSSPFFWAPFVVLGTPN